ncbi:MAG: F0F1 ATP synthase subunit epsilon [Piscirickettsiaceae bacterium CG_4_9_14_3_um_filter_43_564]|nr:F0F1 ATP synthase subunit epsilon [Thiomicrospira sp.]OIP96558.1 MAG: F0F1 ATP synthase subunit epsilon [Thiomicrospira sp. CG2_30_44_34]PIQ02883.1 MAG: F0F1 ATP synthase subunit epsilon [Piscirickettsiaceae bacterium CG18_big_fil_WC_8_21_14_2_50_44_103]PIU38913.1 MAG: F0F1 ATP synthase subunit epsilon [Piscirickettsiaceae bacterium CG07_land_8_20_14_0_80_44_28]PIW57435.1 MAG: F0F1 ATP synthase subunit epsilon [Piscirickettsiaceae bacterium CG12_big_fil_rev_8_21_14_0_65_44_934]PIW78344.1 MA
MAVSMQVDIVSAEGSMFSGKADMVFAQAADGEVGILPKHTQLLSQLKPGQVRVISGDEEDLFFINSGIIEIQPEIVTILADTAIRAEDLDHAAAEEAKQRAEEAMEQAKSDTDIARAQIELAEAVAQIQTITKLRDRLQKTGLS